MLKSVPPVFLIFAACTAVAGSVGEAAKYQAQSMDLRYKIYRSAGNKPLSSDLQALQQEISRETSHGMRDAFSNSINETLGPVQARREAEARKLRETLAKKASAVGTTNAKKTSDSPTSVQAPRTLEAAPTRKLPPPVVLDGKSIPREVEFGKPSTQ